jgi:hypothetical protein
VDGDCDGETDETFTEQNQPCSAGTGECLHNGNMLCVSPGIVQCSVEPGSPQDDLCNGKDDDCDGKTDNIPGTERALTQPCASPVCGVIGQQTCADAAFGPCSAVDPDSDGDGAPDCVDNCLAFPNPTQQDANLNGIGDRCEAGFNCNNPDDTPAVTVIRRQLDNPTTVETSIDRCGNMVLRRIIPGDPLIRVHLFYQGIPGSTTIFFPGVPMLDQFQVCPGRTIWDENETIIHGACTEWFR